MYSKNYFKIGVGLALSYIVVYFFSGVVFLGNSPTLRPHPDQYLAHSVKKQTSILLAKFSRGGKDASKQIENYKQFTSIVAAEGTKQIAPGTYAAEVDGENMILIDTKNNMEKQTVGGRPVYVQTGRRTPTVKELDATLKRLGVMSQQ